MCCSKLEEDVLTADSRSTLLCEEKSSYENCCVCCSKLEEDVLTADSRSTLLCEEKSSYENCCVCCSKLEEDVLTADSRSTLLCEEKSFNENCCVCCSKLEEDVLTADSRSTLLCEEKSFNENCCIRCFCRFFFLFNNKFLCSHCAHNVCKRCCDYDPESRQYICKVCQKQRSVKPTRSVTPADTATAGDFIWWLHGFQTSNMHSK